MDLPDRIGRYDIERMLGQGGMGRVLLARDSVLGRLVAVKILRDDLGIPPEVKGALFTRMRHEARAAAAVSHPHMITLHDMGEDDDVGLYLVFEYVDGPTLRDRIAEDGALSTLEVARIARQLGAALTRAHEAGVIHRDVKPENVMLSATGAKITDFGIARLPDSTLTRTGSVLGTPAYGAPEALATGDFGPASDQFSLAATLYEALCGKRAFPGDDALAVATRVATEEPAPLASHGRDAKLVARADAVLARALSKNKEARYPTVESFGEALASALDRPTTEILEGPRSSVIPRATKRWQNMFAALALITIAALIVVGKRSRARDDDPGVSLKEVASAFASQAGGHAYVAPRAHPPSRASASASANASPSAIASANSNAGVTATTSAASQPSAAPAPNSASSTGSVPPTGSAPSIATPSASATAAQSAAPSSAPASSR